MVSFEPTSSPESERILADILGYPKSWHVVRAVKDGSFFDTIYAGDPKTADTYYNHIAAMDAAVKWNEGESTPYDDNGGQMLPVPTFELSEGDMVEVYYDPDRTWYKAKITKVVNYKDDVRYSVRYTQDRSTQSNICIDMIRLIEGGTKSKSKSSSKKEKASTTTKSTTKGTAKRKKAQDAVKNDKKKGKTEFIPSFKDLELAATMGLPEGWSASMKSASRYTIVSPDGANRFQSKKAAFDFLGMPLPTNEKKSTQTEELDINEAVVEEDDPPWRTSGNDFLGKRVRYEYEPGRFASGTVTGWIAATDVDSNGEPGFISEKTGEPAALYHVSFDSTCAIASQDLEEFELEKSIVPDEEAIE